MPINRAGGLELTGRLIDAQREKELITKVAGKMNKDDQRPQKALLSSFSL